MGSSPSAAIAANPARAWLTLVALLSADRAACSAAGACTYTGDPDSTAPDTTCPEVNLRLLCGKARHASRGNCASCVRSKGDLAGCTDADTDAFCAKRDPCDGFDCGDHGTCSFQTYSDVAHCECRDGWVGDHCEEDSSDQFIPCCNSCGTYCPPGRMTRQACLPTDGGTFFDSERCDAVTRPPAGEDRHDVVPWGADPVADRAACEAIIQIDPSSTYVCADSTDQIEDHSGDTAWPKGVPCEDRTGNVDCGAVVSLYGCNYDVPAGVAGSEDTTGVPGDPDFSGNIGDDLCPRSCGKCPTEYGNNIPNCQDCVDCFNSAGGCSADSCPHCDKCPAWKTPAQPSCTFIPADQGTCRPATAAEDPHDCIRHCAERGQRVDEVNHPGFGLSWCASGHDPVAGCQCDETPQGTCSLGSIHGIHGIDREDGPIEIQDEGCDILPGH